MSNRPEASVLKATAFARRTTAGAGTVGLCLCCFAAAAPAHAELDPAKDKRLYTVANSHLDTQWNWTIQSTIYPYLSNTLHGNFAHFTNHPNYVFNFEGAFRYRLAKEYYPEEYATLKHYIATGRWRVAGSVVDAGDVNVPSPESLFRHILYGNHFFKKEFGRTSTDIFLPDCFGFPYSLPSIAAHSGLKGFSTAKLRWGSAIPFPFQNIGRWIGPDGASVVAVIEPGAYDSAITENLATSTNYLERIERMAATSGLNVDFRYFGTGDIGGAPNPAYVEWLEKSIALGGPIKVLSAGADQLFRDLTPEQVNRLPSYQGELLMRVHGVGCYTSHSEMKTYNRRNELWADAAERAAVIADWLQGGGTYPQERLAKAWERFLWHQFHDDLTGTSIDPAYNFSWNDELLSLKDFASEQAHGVSVLACALDTSAAGVPLVVFNPLSIGREDIVEAEVNFTNGVTKAVRVFGPDGNEVPSQIGSPSGNVLPVTFLARVPAIGTSVFDVRPAASPSALPNVLSVSTSHLENARYRVQLDANGDVRSIFDKAHGRELLSAPIRWAFLHDLSTAWPAWEITYAAVTGTPAYLAGPAKVEILEHGPARVSLTVTRFKDGSAFTERIRLAAGDAGDRVDWDVSANWHTRKTLLKVVFPLAISNPRATYDLGLGTIERGNATPALWEVPAQQWADLTHADGSYGVSVLNDSKYGWDKPNDHTLRLTIFHTPETANNYPHGGHNSIGTHRLSFAVMGHTNDWRAGQSPWAAARLNQPLQAFQTVVHRGALGKTLSFFTCDNPNVMVKALKKAEDSNEVVVRLQELTGQSQTAQLAFAAPITAARELTGAEEPLGPLSPVDGKLNVSLTPYQPKTLAFTLAAPDKLVAKTGSTPITLPFNLDGVSTDAQRADGDFHNGMTYPAELMPAEIVRGGVRFVTGPTADGALNAVACQGQTIALNAADHTQLHFLAAAASSDTAGLFNVDGRATALNIQHFTSFIGQWNPPLLKPADVAWVFTHRHTRDGNDPYRFCYLFKYRLDLPPNAKSLTLPNRPDIRIFAMSLARNPAGETTPSGGPLAANELPWADAGADQQVNTSADGKAMVTLDATRSGDADGKIVSHAWSLNGTALATGINPTAELDLGTNAILLTVTDDRGATSQDLVTVTVLKPLIVALTASPTNAGAAPLTIQFSGAAGNGDTPTYNYAWNFGDGATSSLPNPRHTFLQNGNFPVVLSAAQGRYSGTNRMMVTVGPPLTASATAMASTNRASQWVVQFNGLASGGNGSRAPFNTTDDGLGDVTAQGGNAPAEGELRAFDNDPKTKWLDFNTVYPSLQSSWIQYRFARDWPHVVTRYAVTSANDFPGRDPRDWRLLGSHDGTNWITLDVRGGEAFPERFQRREFSVANPAGCCFYRLQIDSVHAPSTAGCVQLAELELIGAPVYAYFWSFSDSATATAPNPHHTFTRPGPFTASLVVSDGVASATNTITVPAAAGR